MFINVKETKQSEKNQNGHKYDIAMHIFNQSQIFLKIAHIKSTSKIKVFYVANVRCNQIMLIDTEKLDICTKHVLLVNSSVG